MELEKSDLIFCNKCPFWEACPVEIKGLKDSCPLWKLIGHRHQCLDSSNQSSEPITK